MSWFKKPKNIILTVLTAVLFAACAVCLVWAITNHTEKTLMRVCWVNDVAHYQDKEESADCPVEELIWPKQQIPIEVIPITSTSQPLAEDTREMEILRHTTSDINAQLGFELLKITKQLHEADADVQFGILISQEQLPPGRTFHMRVGRKIRGFVQIRSDVGTEDRLLFLVLRHELLHLAGLAHDDYPMSVMFPVTAPEWDIANMTTAFISDDDKAALRRLYKQQ